MTKKGAAGDFFFHFAKKYFFPKPKKEMEKTKKNAAALLTIILATRWTGNILFFLWAALGFFPAPGFSYKASWGNEVVTCPWSVILRVCPG